MSYEELRLKAEIVVKVLDEFERDLTAAILDPGLASRKDTYRVTRHRARVMRDEIREEWPK